MKRGRMEGKREEGEGRQAGVSLERGGKEEIYRGEKLPRESRGEIKYCRGLPSVFLWLGIEIWVAF